MPPRGVKKGSKRGRQYEHIKGSLEQRGSSESKAEEIVASLELPPDWPQDDPLGVDALRMRFDRTGSLTIGLEEELMLVDAETLELLPAAERVLEQVGDPRFTHELRLAQIEVVTPVCQSVPALGRELASARRTLLGALDAGTAVAAAGTHPFSTDWGEVARGERYRKIADEYTLMGSGNLPCGLHVHVAVGGADRSLAVYNALRSYLPEIGALAANSPFLAGRDTGVCSIRAKLSEALPRAGVPPAFQSWQLLADFLAWGHRAGFFPDMTHFWWDLRLHPGHGTIELRVADAQTRIEDAVSVAALYQSLVAWLAERYDGGEQLPVHGEARIRENAWRSLRYGVRGYLADLDTGVRVATRERLASLLTELEPTAQRLGCVTELAHAGTLLAGNGADRQRYVAECDGIRGLARWLVHETEASAA